MEPIFLKYLVSTAAAVREQGVESAELMAKKFGVDWALQNFIPKVVEKYGEDKLPYNHRISCLKSLACLIPHLRSDML